MSIHVRPTPPRPDQLPVELVESLSDLLATMLVAEWRARHSQTVTELMVNSPRGINHDDSRGTRCREFKANL